MPSGTPPYRDMGERLLKWALDKFGTKAEAARKLGKNQSNLDRYLKGLLPISYEFEQRLRKFDADVEFIKTGKKKASLKDQVEFPEVDLVQIPVFEYARAGTKSMALLERPSYFISSAKTKDDTLFAVVVKGKSMEPEVKEGELVVVSKKRDPKKGDLCLIMFEDGDCCLRRVYFQDHTVTLTSSNEREYPPAIHKKSEIRFIYRVVQKTTTY